MQVFFSARPLRFGKLRIDWENSDAGTGERHNIYKRHVIASLGQDGSVTFADGTKEENIDSVLFATGYQFNFPFLDKSGVISVQDNRLGSTEKQILASEMLDKEQSQKQCAIPQPFPYSRKK